MDTIIDRLIDEARQADDCLYALARCFLSPEDHEAFRKQYIDTRNKWIAATAEDYRARIRKMEASGF